MDRMILFLAPGALYASGVSNLFIFRPPVSEHFSASITLSALADPLLDFALEPSRCHFPDAPTLRKSPFAHHAPDRGSAEGNQLSEFLESDVSHFCDLLSKAVTNERFNSVHLSDSVFGG
jgi:hypothetical protein